MAPKRGPTTAAAVGNKTCRINQKGPMYSAQHYVHVARIIGDAWARARDNRSPGLRVSKLVFLAELVIMFSWEFDKDSEQYDEARFLEAVLGNLLEFKHLLPEEVEELTMCIGGVAHRRGMGEGGTP